MRLPEALAGRRAVLVVGHPGHELRVHGWLTAARPEVWVLTDGSGGSSQGRLTSTTALLRSAGATAGPVYGRFSDRAAYAMILAGEARAAAEVVRELARTLVDGADYVVGDALEGFNPTHDLCRVIVDLAVGLARGRCDRPIDNLAFTLEAGPGAVYRDPQSQGLVLELDACEVERKLAAARQYPELAAEIESALAHHGAGAFAIERLEPVDIGLPVPAQLADPPGFERCGEERVAAGRYERVLRLREHFLPFVAALRELTEAG